MMKKVGERELVGGRGKSDKWEILAPGDLNLLEKIDYLIK